MHLTISIYHRYSPWHNTEIIYYHDDSIILLLFDGFKGVKLGSDDVVTEFLGGFQTDSASRKWNDFNFEEKNHKQIS